ncbi:MAG: hypothetical protein JXR90_17350 [Spirochaetes bacterium]|nr:hypothetical protein [Spirochaetota bacterium]
MAISIIKDNSESGFTKNIYITLCLVALMLTRMEGVITSFFIIIFYLLNGDFKFDTRRIIFGSFLFFSSVYIAVLGFALVGNRSYSPQRYILFLLLMITTYLVDLIFIRKNKKILRNLSWIIISAAFLTLILLSLSNDELSKSLAIFASNSFNEVYWGLTNHAFVILFAVICYNRIKTRRHNEEHDSHIYLFLFSVLLILILANFHPYRKGWFDSANRMLFHFMPLLVVWIGIEVNKLIFYRKY